MSAAPPVLDRVEGLEAVSCIHASAGRDLWLVRNPVEDRAEVLKRATDPVDSTGRDAIIEEFLLLDRIRHPHWIRPLGFHHLADGTCGYRMPFVRGRSPDQGQGSEFSPTDPEAIRAILGALASLHALGLAHLDLKPSQFLLGSDGLLLIDPGLAAAEGSAIPPRGTWGFIAPEILAGDSWDRRADLYGLGCAILQIWTGERPLGGGDLAEQARRKAIRLSRQLRDRLQGMPEGVDRWVDTLLAHRPENRPRDAFEAWRTLHAVAGYRADYVAKSRLPLPVDLPLVPPDGLEAKWREAVRGSGPERWCVEGPWGSGRRRLLHRLKALAEVEGAGCNLQADRLAAGSVVCRIGRADFGEERVVLGPIGASGARAALEAFGLEPEGGEAEWLPALLRLRIMHRLGGEAERRASGRYRRSLAAASADTLSRESADRLATALAAIADGERPSPLASDPLLQAGYARVAVGGKLQLAIPPWDLESLRIVVGPEAIESAHRFLLRCALASGSADDPVTLAWHAIEAGEPERTAELIPAAVQRLRSEGRPGPALDLLEKAEAVAGGEIPERWKGWRAHLAMEEGSPTRCLALARRGPESVPGEWRRAIEAYLTLRAGRYLDAIAMAESIASGDDRELRFAARMITLRGLLLMGKWEEAEREGASLLDAARTEDAPTRRSAPAQALLSALASRGRTGPEVDEVRAICEEELDRVGLRERQMLANALGADAFLRADFGRARRYFEIAGEAAETAGDGANLVSAQSNLAGILFEEGSLAESEAVNRSAIEIAERINDPRRVAMGRRNLAAVLLYAGRLGEALDAIRAARAGFESLTDAPAAFDAIALETSILVEIGLGESAAAVASSLEAPEASENLAPPAMAVLLRDRARALRESGRLVESRALLEESARIAADCGAVDEVARTRLEIEALELAAHGGPSNGSDRDWPASSEASADIEVRRLFVDAQSGAADGGEQKLAAAIELLERAAARSEQAQLRLWTWRCRAAQAGLHRQRGNSAMALRALREASDALGNLMMRIGSEVLRESYILRPDPRRFLAWCDGDAPAVGDQARGSSDLEVFLK